MTLFMDVFINDRKRTHCTTGHFSDLSIVSSFVGDHFLAKQNLVACLLLPSNTSPSRNTNFSDDFLFARSNFNGNQFSFLTWSTVSHKRNLQLFIVRLIFSLSSLVKSLIIDLDSLPTQRRLQPSSKNSTGQLLRLMSGFEMQPLQLINILPQDKHTQGIFFFIFYCTKI